jgi:hypothetical protein
VRRERERRTVEAMVLMYCRAHHGGTVPCTECAALLDYSNRRLERCLFGDAKPTCANCVVHCYRADMRERIREVMRWAGPRMLWRHPVLGVRHLLDGRRPALMLPARSRPKTVAACGPDPQAAPQAGAPGSGGEPPLRQGRS